MHYFSNLFDKVLYMFRRSQWPRGLRRRSAAAGQLRLWVRIPPVAWMPVCCDCWVLSGRGLCDELITRPEESYRLWCVVVCDLETSWMRRPWFTGGCHARNKQNSTCFGQVHCPLSGVSQHSIHSIGICHASSISCLLAWSGWNWFHPDNASRRQQD
jgi:hypothetical protein